MTFARTHAVALAATCAGCFAPEPGDEAEHETTAPTTTAPAEGTSHATTSAESSSSAPESVGDGSSGRPDSSGDVDDAGESTDEDTSAGKPPTCAVDTPFAEPTLVTELDTDMHEDHAWLSQDELTVYLSSNRDGDLPGYDIYAGARDGLDEPFGELTLLTGSDAEDRRPSLTADGLTIYLASSPVGALSYDLMVATRPNVLAEFGALAPVGVVNSEESDSAPAISPDGTTLWFDSQRTGLGDIYRTQRSGDGPFEEPTPVGELNTPSAEAAPVPSADGLTIWFASNRAGGVGDLDVWIATRSSTKDGFGEATNVPEVSSDGLDWPTWVSLDGCRLYLGSRRPDGGDYSLWVAERGE
jgi:hypothetical protein